MSRGTEDWVDKEKFDDAECTFLRLRSLVEKNKPLPQPDAKIAPKGPKGDSEVKKPVTEEKKPPMSTLVSEINNARERIRNTLDKVDSENFDYISVLEEKYNQLSAKVDYLSENVSALTELCLLCKNSIYAILTHVKLPGTFPEEIKNKVKQASVPSSAFNSDIGKSTQHFETKKKPELEKVNNAEPLCHQKVAIDQNDDDIDLFQSDEEENDEVSRLREERLRAYETKKSAKAPVIAKSFVVFDVKPWSDETDLKEMEKHVRKIETDGLTWGASKLVPIAFGIKALQIAVVIEDEKVSTDWLQETIEEIKDHVQSVDIVTFNKL